MYTEYELSESFRGNSLSNEYGNYLDERISEKKNVNKFKGPIFSK